MGSTQQLLGGRTLTPVYGGHRPADLRSAGPATEEDPADSLLAARAVPASPLRPPSSLKRPASWPAQPTMPRRPWPIMGHLDKASPSIRPYQGHTTIRQQLPSVAPPRGGPSHWTPPAAPAPAATQPAAPSQEPRRPVPTHNRRVGAGLAAAGQILSKRTAKGHRLIGTAAYRKPVTGNYRTDLSVGNVIRFEPAAMPPDGPDLPTTSAGWHDYFGAHERYSIAWDGDATTVTSCAWTDLARLRTPPAQATPADAATQAHHNYQTTLDCVVQAFNSISGCSLSRSAFLEKYKADCFVEEGPGGGLYCDTATLLRVHFHSVPGHWRIIEVTTDA